MFLNQNGYQSNPKLNYTSWLSNQLFLLRVKYGQNQRRRKKKKIEIFERRILKIYRPKRNNITLQYEIRNYIELQQLQ